MRTYVCEENSKTLTPDVVGLSSDLGVGHDADEIIHQDGGGRALGKHGVCAHALGRGGGRYGRILGLLLC